MYSVHSPGDVVMDVSLQKYIHNWNNCLFQSRCVYSHKELHTLRSNRLLLVKIDSINHLLSHSGLEFIIINVETGRNVNIPRDDRL